MDGWPAKVTGPDGHLSNNMVLFERARTKIAGAEQHI
jgi:hypothetical protein